MIDIFELDGLGSEYQNWLSQLPIPRTIRKLDLGSSRPLWTGEPFVLAGSRESILAWLRGLDVASAKLIRDHAYFWVLISGGSMDHALIREDRLIVLDWNSREYNVISGALEELARFPLMAGLSYEMQHLREEVLRVGSGDSEPATPVLILGESGTGKECAVQSIFAANHRGPAPGLHAIGGAWLKMDPGVALAGLFGIGGQIATGVSARPGLLETYSKGAIFVDDFETAPPLLQEVFLRIASTKKGTMATYHRVGEPRDLKTNVWLLFATNGDIRAMLASGVLRLDFLFRFEDRVVVVPPLRGRPADLPAIARRIWGELVAGGGGLLGGRVLPWSSLRDLVGRGLKWTGNVRELAALLRLVASMCRMPGHRADSVGALIDLVLARGPGLMEWLGILASGDFSAAPKPPAPNKAAEVLAYDNGDLVDDLSPCEQEVASGLGVEAWAELNALVDRNVHRDRREVRRRLCRCLIFVVRFRSITNADAKAVTGLGPVWAAGYLKWLAGGSLFLVPPAESTGNALVYTAGARLIAGFPALAADPQAPAEQ